MKKMVTYLVTLGMMLSMIPAQVSAEENAVLSIAATQETQQEPVINPNLYMFGGYVATQSGDLNLREDANTSSKILTSIPNGTQLDIYSSGIEGWYLTIYDHKKGYVSADFIKPVEGYDERSYHEDPNLPASSISVASLAGTWTDMRTFETLVIRNVRDAAGVIEIYKGEFTFTDKDGKKTEGTIKLEYTYNPDNSREYWFTFYDNSGKLWCSFIAESTIQLDHLIAGQSGDPYYFGHYLFGGFADVKDSLNLRSDLSTNSDIITTIPAGTQLNIFDSQANGWYKTIYDGKIGYVSADYIKKIESSDVVVPKKEIKDIKEIIGRWRFEIADDKYSSAICADYAGIIDVKEDGSFTYTDADNKVSTGQITESEDVYADGTSLTVLTFNAEGKILFSGYYRKGAEFISSGNSDIDRLIKDTAWNEGIEQTAIEKMENYAKIDNILACALTSSNTDIIKVDNYEYRKVIDTNYKTIADIKNFINANTTGDLNKKLLENCDHSFKEVNGVLYELNGGRGSVDIDTSKGLIVTDKTDKSFTATTVAFNRITGQLHTRAFFTAVGDDWKISNIEYDSYTVNRSSEDFRTCALARISALKTLMQYISGDADVYENEKIKVNGVDYVKVTNQHGTPDILKASADNCSTGDLRKRLYSMIENQFIVKDGVVYIRTQGQSSPDFPLDLGVTILEITPDTFSAVTVDSSQRDGYTIVDFAKDGDKFLISGYEFSIFDTKRLFGGSVATQSGDLNLREAPNTTSKILDAIPNGTQLDIYDCGVNGWYKVVFKGKIGYVSSEFIKKIESSDIPVSTTTTTTTTSSSTTTTTTTTTTTEKKKGDVNGDDAINLKDVVMMRRYIAGGWNVTVDEKIADVNKDGAVNLKDVVLLRRYIAGGWGVEL